MVNFNQLRLVSDDISPVIHFDNVLLRARGNRGFENLELSGALIFEEFCCLLLIFKIDLKLF